jgi:hypothetical protein
MRRWALLVILVAGCSSALEDGYEPHKLNANAEDRRSWYVDSFAPGARSTDNSGPYGDVDDGKSQNKPVQVR